MKYLVLGLLSLLSFNALALTKAEVSQTFKRADKNYKIKHVDYCYDLVENRIKKEMTYRIKRDDIFHTDMAIIMDYINEEGSCTAGLIVDYVDKRLKKNGFETKIVHAGTNSAYCMLVISWLR